MPVGGYRSQPRGRRKWGWQYRRVSHFPAKLAEALAQKEALRYTDQDLAYLVAQLRVGAAPSFGSTELEQMSTNRDGTGLFDLLGAPASHHVDSRKDPSGGLPDIVAVPGTTLVLAEMKHNKEYPGGKQKSWLEKLAGVTHVWSGVVWPDDWTDFCDLMLELELEGRRG